MDPPSPSKFPMSPGMPIFPVSPERVAGTKPPYSGPAPSSPSLPDLRTSPLRSLSHRRKDSDVSVHGLAAMFENLEVKDFKEAQATYMKALQKQKTKHVNEVKDIETKHRQAVGRYEIRLEELNGELKRAKEALKEETFTREQWDKQRKEHREAEGKWEEAAKHQKEKRTQAEAQAHKLVKENTALTTHLQGYKKRCKELQKESLAVSGAIPKFQSKIQSLERDLRIAESDVKHQTNAAENFKRQVYGLQVGLESVEANLREELQQMKEKVKLIEEERDALLTSLKEEEILRIAAEGRIPLPAATTEEHDEFESPVRSPRKLRSFERDDEDKENISPKKAAIDLRFLQQELAQEKRLRERAEEQIDFMKMECQFQCCSCRIADLKGSKYVHDGNYTAEMERIKATVPVVTPPSSSHGDDPIEGITIKEEPMDEPVRPFTPTEQPPEPADNALDVTAFPNPPVSTSEPLVTFSPTTGTFRSVPSPVKDELLPKSSTPASARPALSSIIEATMESSPWAPDASSTMIRTETVSPPPFRPAPQPEPVMKSLSQNITIHEDAIADSDDENSEPQTPPHSPPGPATPSQYLTRTITTTTTIPIHFSPLTPAVKTTDAPITPSTIAHVPTNTSSRPLGELSLNNLPFDREAALEQIRQRRGRARSMAAGQGTPRKQMMEGVGARRDISAPVTRVRR
ncbi:hypothetical protein K469DRAFT_650524 [Zopfia rhizophila CBS 207.26]|uniref:Uncharacterized protein n=1 Tax=Zopfia rhizophila CBS 207.26 TaxID=1314779 RepID=A0A6A6ESS4_9PEZI|nr:hypothetical protein K469DRAFT_650524 [Zopfia rhizophila CBS 207.26]